MLQAGCMAAAQSTHAWGCVADLKACQCTIAGACLSKLSTLTTVLTQADARLKLHGSRDRTPLNLKVAGSCGAVSVMVAAAMPAIKS